MWPYLLSIVVIEQIDRARKYDYAWKRSVALGKPLLVIGGPFGDNPARAALGFMAHPCGDICLDLISCDPCGSERSIIADLRTIPLGDKSVSVAFVSHVLEHLPSEEDARIAVAELHRVADEVVIVGPKKTNLLAWLHPGHHLWVSDDGQSQWFK